MLEIRELTAAGIFVRIMTSMLLGGIIGMERGIKNRPAGMKTYMLVNVGACVVMLVNQYVYQAYGVGDPVRMGAQVVSGIGFLGAGTIMVTSHNQIKGLTTAAGLWASACIGLAVGIGLYEVAATGGAAIFIVLAVLHGIDLNLRNKSNVVEMYVELDSSVGLGRFLRNARDQDLELSGFQREPEDSVQGDVTAFIVTVTGRKSISRSEIIGLIRRFEGVRYFETL